MKWQPNKLPLIILTLFTFQIWFFNIFCIYLHRNFKIKKNMKMYYRREWNQSIDTLAISQVYDELENILASILDKEVIDLPKRGNRLGLPSYYEVAKMLKRRLKQLKNSKNKEWYKDCMETYEYIMFEVKD